MARNEEKSQSMLFRFREAQQAELGLTNRKTDRRPRLASSVNTLRECERWRGEILREISRKVSKIQDIGLTDYEIRDLNDEINKLMREKNHWEKQIVALGGANYRRTGAMLDEDGKEVPGTRGYKYFGRARELPGVKEMFTKNTAATDEDSLRAELYKRYRNQGPVYYGDADEADASLLEDDRAAEEKEWAAAYDRLSERLSLDPSTSPFPPFPAPASAQSAAFPPPSSAPAPKRPAPTDDDTPADVEMTSVEEGAVVPDASKKSKLAASEPASTSEPALSQSAGYAAIALGGLNAADLAPPKLLGSKEMEAVLLQARKKVLLEEYLGKESTA